MNTKYSIRMEGADLLSETWETTWEEFARDNEGDDDLLDAVSSLRVGESEVFGGGASPIFTITRTE